MLRLLFIILIIGLTSATHAQEQTPSYVIELEQIEATSESKVQTISDELQQKLDDSGFIVTSPEKNDAFIFGISDTTIDFSDIVSSRQKTNSTLLHVTGSGSFGYEIHSILKQPFQSALGESIPQTSCNSTSPCSASLANTWTDTNSYGWGYQLSGPDVIKPFKDDTFYRIIDEKKPVIFSGNSSASGERSTKLTIKVQVPAGQSEGNYTGIIKVIAVPKL